MDGAIDMLETGNGILTDKLPERVIVKEKVSPSRPNQGGDIGARIFTNRGMKRG